MSRASFFGTRILLRQVSPESEGIFDLILDLSRCCDGDWNLLAETTGVSESSVERFLEYSASFLDSVGNYRGYGDRKILPRISKQDFQQLCSASASALTLFQSVEESIFSPEQESIGYPDTGGMSSYYIGSTTITKDADSKTFEVLVASVDENPSAGKTVFELPKANCSITITLKYGDHSDALLRVCESIKSALNFVRSEDQALYLRKLLGYFSTGAVEDQRAGSEAWVRDASPPVETVIGFMEPYRDPSAIRREWMGLVAIQNKAQTKVFNKLAASAEEFIKDMPWTKLEDHEKGVGLGPFENERFVRPDFVSLDILTFSVSNCWTGITGPSFTDVRAAYGRKNIYFSNRASAVNMHAEVPFIPVSDREEYCRLRGLGFTTIVAIHELIGHGCGKILEEKSSGNYNFDPQNPPSIFGGTYTVLNECLAESIALYLIPDLHIQELMGVSSTTSDLHNFTYHAWLQMISMCLKALLSYDVKSKKWGQSHDRARFGMIKCLCQAGNGLLEITASSATTSEQPELEIHLNRDLIPTVGRAALGDLILHLQIYRCTAGVLSGRDYMEKLTVVDDVYEKWREAVVFKRQKRPLFVQANTILSADGEHVILKEYPATKEGLIQSWVDRKV